MAPFLLHSVVVVTPPILPNWQ